MSDEAYRNYLAAMPPRKAQWVSAIGLQCVAGSELYDIEETAEVLMAMADAEAMVEARLADDARRQLTKAIRSRNEWEDNAERLQEQLDRVAALHQPFRTPGVDGQWCAGDHSRYPCATVRALEDAS